MLLEVSNSFGEGQTDIHCDVNHESSSWNVRIHHQLVGCWKDKALVMMTVIMVKYLLSIRGHCLIKLVVEIMSVTAIILHPPSSPTSQTDRLLTYTISTTHLLLNTKHIIKHINKCCTNDTICLNFSQILYKLWSNLNIKKFLKK